MKSLKERRKIEDHFYSGGDVNCSVVGGSESVLKFSGDRDSQLFDWENYEYRIKKNPTVRPWTKEEFLKHIDCWFRRKKIPFKLLEKVTWVSSDESFKIGMKNDWQSLETLFKFYELYDLKTGQASPCGVEVTNVSN